MALIKCPECGKKVSDIAHSCPKCGAPIKEDEYEEEQTIQLTSKNLKAQGCLSLFIIVLGFILAAIGGKTNESVAHAGAYIVLFGILWLIIARIRVWWHHK